jgi:uncharacterized protein (UPF0147 family)
MSKVYNQLTDRNLTQIANAPTLPYNIRKMAQKILDDRRKDARYSAMLGK